MSKKPKGKKPKKKAVEKKTIDTKAVEKKTIEKKIDEKDLDKYLIGLIIGIKYRPNFAIEDQLGKITDSILYDKNSFFSPEIFPHVQNNVGKKTLLNYDTGDNLQIDNTNIILTINFHDNEPTGFKIADYGKIISNFQKQIMKKAMCKFGLNEISRVGIVRKYSFPLEKLPKTFAHKTIGSTLGGVNDINLNFSKKEPMPKSAIQKNVSDYCNVIFNIIKPKTNELFISIDYQWFYIPFLEKVNDIKFEPFEKSANDFNKKKFLPWLNKNYIQEETS